MTKPSISKIGIWTDIQACPVEEQIKFAQKAEKHGFGAIWIPDIVAKDSFVTLAVLAHETDSIHLATGIANIYARAPMAMTGAYASMDELSNGRFILGLGVSHSELVSQVMHIDYTKPVASMRSYLDSLGVGSAAVAKVTPENAMARQGCVVLAALGGNMMALAAEKADGAHPYLVTPEHTANARRILGPESFLAPVQFIVLEKDPSVARAVARQHLQLYLGLRNYRRNWIELGFNESDFESGGSDRLVDALVAWGREDKILKHLESHFENGADHVAIRPLRPDGRSHYDEKALKAFALKD